MTHCRKPFSILLLLLVLTSLTAAAPALPPSVASLTMPDELMSAVLSASAQPFTATADGYLAHSGGLDVVFDTRGLHAQAEGKVWSLSLRGWGRGEQVVPVPEAEIVQSDRRLEYRRGALTEWYRDTTFGIEQGLSLNQAPPGAGPLVLQFDLSSELAGRLDADGRGLSFAAPEGGTLRYDHLRAWDANSAALDARLLYAPSQITLVVDDNGAAYPLAIDPLIYREQKVSAFGKAGISLGYSVAVSGDTALVGARYGAGYVFIRSGIAWTLQQILAPSDSATGDEFGTSVALSGDTALVGAPRDDVGANSDQGSAYVFVRNGTTWTQQAKLTAFDGAAWDEFGYSVALSGDTALVGAYNDDVGSNLDQGSGYVFTRSGTTWTLQQKLSATDGAAEEHFGYSVALAGDTALVGAHSADGGHGAAYVLTRNGTTWTQQAKLTASDGAVGDLFGDSVALSGDTALVGASQDDIGANGNQGSAYVFIRSGTTWTQQAKMTTADGAAWDLFGVSVALSGDTALVGAFFDNVGANTQQGSAYVFTRSGTTWTLQQKLTASDGAAYDVFGWSVALSSTTALVGAFSDDVGVNTNQGSAYVFVWTGMAWGPQAKLTAVDGAPSDRFGYSVAISGNTALVGVISDDIGANTDQGSAFVFTRSGGTWTLQQKLIASDGAADDGFGFSVALSGTTAIVGAPYHDVGANTVQGAAYVFVYSWPYWTQQTKLTAADGQLGDFFGYSVALSGDTTLVGAYLNDGAYGDQGAAYVFTRSGTSWSQQQKLTAPDGASADRFGNSVALSGNTALVGAYFDTVGANGMQGSAYVFIWTGTTWALQRKLTASDGAASDAFGYSVALSGETALVGAHGANADKGAAYAFTRSGTTWTQQVKLVASDGALYDAFGYSVALSDSIAVVGAFNDDVGADIDRGSAYVFTRSGSTWIQQAKLTASDGAASDAFGYSVALSGNMALVGAYLDDVGPNIDQGSAYFYDLMFGTYLPLLRRDTP